MKITISKRMLSILIAGVMLSIVLGLGSSLFIHSMGDILSGAEGLLGEDADTFGQIFNQLKTAEVELPSIMLLILCLLETAGVLRFVRGKKEGNLSRKKRILRGIGIALPALIGLLLIVVTTLWFTDVNGIRFGTVVKFLYDALQHGVF